MCWRDENGALCLPDDGVGDAPVKGTLHPSSPARAEDHHVDAGLGCRDQLGRGGAPKEDRECPRLGGKLCDHRVQLLAQLLGIRRHVWRLAVERTGVSGESCGDSVDAQGRAVVDRKVSRRVEGLA